MWLQLNVLLRLLCMLFPICFSLHGMVNIVNYPFQASCTQTLVCNTDKGVERGEKKGWLGGWVRAPLLRNAVAPVRDAVHNGIEHFPFFLFLFFSQQQHIYSRTPFVPPCKKFCFWCVCWVSRSDELLIFVCFFVVVVGFLFFVLHPRNVNEPHESNGVCRSPSSQFPVCKQGCKYLTAMHANIQAICSGTFVIQSSHMA